MADQNQQNPPAGGAPAPKPKKDRGPSGRDWCFTLNNYVEDDIQRLLAMEHNYIIFETEHDGERPEWLGPEEPWTRHIQGFVQFKDQKFLTGAINAFPGDVE